jgi:sterol desaturase/sphingolipid hydroxylase (fatty acid hydroxylase superfamily)
MKKKIVLNKSQRIIIRIINLVWAICLLAPLLIIADTCKNRAFFHLLLFLQGWLAWAYSEYFIHRFIMHECNEKSKLGKLLNHTHHHVDPEDIRVSNRHRLLMIAGSILIISVSIIADNHVTVFCGYFIGFTIYSFMHVILHYKWSVKVFPRLHQFHLLHHCRHSDKCFGVVFTGWDQLFGTAPSVHTEITERIKEFYYKKENKKQLPGNQYKNLKAG